MSGADATPRLERIADSDDFASESSVLIEAWDSDGVGFDVVGPILAFMEEHPKIDYGAPGPLVHFVERFRGHGYEDRLLESVARRPTRLTAWMLNRLINGAKTEATRRELVVAHPMADDETRDDARRFVDRAEKSV